MLVLTRRVGESISIGKDVVVTILSRDKKQVKIGVTAPRDVLVLRTELEKRDGR